MFTDPLLSNERRSIVECFYVAGMCLPTRCLAMGIHVTIFSFCGIVGDVIAGAEIIFLSK
jgi:hypothetical protein